jgi:putative Mg2+ transporter-C (MgtC) family protein
MQEIALQADWTEISLRLGAAILAGAIIGVNRDLHGKPAGIRLNALVAMAGALLMIVAESLSLAGDDGGFSRIIQGLIGGVGFLGAGMIIREGDGSRIQNLTTAATILVTTSIGVACGLGLWRVGLVAAGAALFLLTVGLFLERAVFGKAGPELPSKE